MAAYDGGGPSLFAGVMIESPFLATHRTVAESEWLFDYFSKGVGCASATNQMACLRGKSVAQLQVYDHSVAFPGQTEKPGWSWLPVIDGNFSRRLIYDGFEQGKFKSVPALSKLFLKYEVFFGRHDANIDAST